MDRDVSALNCSIVSGGDINDAYKIELLEDVFFIKLNDKVKLPIFECERQGLELLNDNSAFAVPKPLLVGATAQHSFIIMEHFELGSGDANSWEKAAEKLAELHKNSSEFYGLDHSNFIGSLKQSNQQHESWPRFFDQERIRPLMNRAIGRGLLNSKALDKWDDISLKLNSIFPDTRPSLLHGDLWSGNISFNHNGFPAIYDPAVYYGHFEMELAFTQLFGGFPSDFINMYSSYRPIEPGFSKRKELYNLYPLLVHLNLFGSGYLSGVESILKKFS